MRAIIMAAEGTVSAPVTGGKLPKTMVPLYTRPVMSLLSVC